MTSDCFIDTNIWVYAFLESEKDSSHFYFSIFFAFSNFCFFQFLLFPIDMLNPFI